MQRDATIVVTGATGQVGRAVATALADEHHVIAAARFGDAAVRAELEAAGVVCVPVDLAAGALDALPDAPTYVVHMAVAKTGDWRADLDANAQGLGRLLAHCRGARSALVCSTTGVYADTGAEPYAEDAPLGDNHGTSPYLPTYSISKIAAEEVARLSATLWDLPVTIARLNVPYGDTGGWPAIMLDLARAGIPTEVPIGGDARYAPIHTDDVCAMVGPLLDAATVPGTVVNWGGPDVVSVRAWTDYLTERTGVEIPLVETATAIPSVVPDLTRQRALVGEAQVRWRDGFDRMLAARYPDLVR